jgi:hypothetical protein
MPVFNSRMAGQMQEHFSAGSAGDLIRTPVLHHFKQIIQSNKTKKWNHSQTLIYQHNSWGYLRPQAHPTHSP